MNERASLSVTRRDALQWGLALAAASIGPTSFSADSSTSLITKAIPSSGEKLPAVGVGTNSFADANLASLQVMMSRMHDLGGKVIDTAAAYGESEATIGKLLSNLKLRDSFFISTKLTAGGAMNMGPPPGAGGGGGAAPQGGPPQGAGQGGPPAGMGGMSMDNVSGEKSFERSLERLQTNRLDLLMVHNMNGVDELMPKLQEWKKAGKIRYLGMTTSNTSQHAQMVEYLKKYPVDFVQVNYSIESREAEQDVLPLALERKVGVMVNVPFGGRGGRTLLSADGRMLPSFAKDIGCDTWSAFLLKFVISHPAVTVAIPGSTKLEHMEANQAAAHGVLPDAAMRKRMQEFWDKKA